VLTESDVFYQTQAKDPQAARQYLQQHPELQQFLSFKEQAVMTDPLLQKYYGGIQFVEGAWRRQMYAKAEDLFGTDIQDVQQQFFNIKDEGGDTQTYLAQHPQLAGPFTVNGVTYNGGYWEWLRDQKAELAKDLLKVGDLLPETPAGIIRPDADKKSITSQAVLQGMQDMTGQTTAQQATVAAYSYDMNPAPTTFSLSSWMDIQAEKNWRVGQAKPVHFTRRSEPVGCPYLPHGQPGSGSVPGVGEGDQGQLQPHHGRQRFEDADGSGAGHGMGRLGAGPRSIGHGFLCASANDRLLPLGQHDCRSEAAVAGHMGVDGPAVWLLPSVAQCYEGNLAAEPGVFGSLKIA
jgi:hypothetical protein